MKLSKRQLKRIIREEKRRILREMGPGHHGGMYGNPGDWGDPNQWDAEVEEEDFCPYSYLEKMKELHPGDYAVDAKLPRMGFDPDTGRELTDHEMQMVYDVIDEEEEERAYAEDMRMMESRRLSKRQLMRIIREEKEKIEKELEEDNDEGNAFTGALAKAKEQGKDTFKVDGKTYDVKESRRFRSKLLRAIRNQKRLALESKKKIINNRLKRILREMAGRGDGMGYVDPSIDPDQIFQIELFIDDMLGYGGGPDLSGTGGNPLAELRREIKHAFPEASEATIEAAISQSSYAQLQH